MCYRSIENGGECFVYKISRMRIATKLHAVFHVTELDRGFISNFRSNWVDLFYQFLLNENCQVPFWFVGYWIIVLEFENIHLKIVIVAMRINEHMPTFIHVLNQNSSTNTWITRAPNNVLLNRRNSKRTLNYFMEFHHSTIEMFIYQFDNNLNQTYSQFVDESNWINKTVCSKRWRN